MNMLKNLFRGARAFGAFAFAAAAALVAALVTANALVVGTMPLPEELIVAALAIVVLCVGAWALRWPEDHE